MTVIIPSSITQSQNITNATVKSIVLLSKSPLPNPSDEVTRNPKDFWLLAIDDHWPFKRSVIFFRVSNTTFTKGMLLWRTQKLAKLALVFLTLWYIGHSLVILDYVFLVYLTPAFFLACMCVSRRLSGGEVGSFYPTL